MLFVFELISNFPHCLVSLPVSLSDSEPGKVSPPLQLPLLPPGLQQMQQLLGGLNPAQLQQLLQQNVNNFADSGRKQLEQLIPQLQAGWRAVITITTTNTICKQTMTVCWDAL